MQCSAAGFVIITPDKKTLKLDTSGNAALPQELKALQKKDHLRADVTGEVEGDTLKVQSIKLPCSLCRVAPDRGGATQQRVGEGLGGRGVGQRDMQRCRFPRLPNDARCEDASLIPSRARSYCSSQLVWRAAHCLPSKLLSSWSVEVSWACRLLCSSAITEFARSLLNTIAALQFTPAQP
jgi:hypothetical protein